MGDELESNLVVPFGKYKGKQPELLLADQSYFDWCVAQPDLVSKYRKFFDLVRQVADTNEDCTPEHNRLQAKFLDPEFQNLFVKNLLRKSSLKKAHPPSFEIPVGGQFIDVYFWTILINKETGEEKNYRFLIEIKPTIGDDYPKILRKINAVMHSQMREPWSTIYGVLCGNYNGTIPIENVRKVFDPVALIIENENS